MPRQNQIYVVCLAFEDAFTDTRQFYITPCVFYFAGYGLFVLDYVLALD